MDNIKNGYVSYVGGPPEIVDPWLSTDSEQFKKDVFAFIQAYNSSLKRLFNIELVDLVSYLRESKYNGYPEEPGGSVWTSEGKFIYVMIRHLKPKSILEIGNFKGRGSTNHILQAVEMNGVGEVTLLDIVERLEYDKLHSKNFNRVLEDSLEYLKRPMSFDFVVQDGCHTYEHVKKELALLVENNDKEFWIWGHDYFQNIPGVCEVTKAWDESHELFHNLTPLKDGVSDCGFIIGKKILNG
jgi:hypothetical protein